MIDQLGDDVPLLTRNDKWLETQRLNISKQITALSAELRVIMLAQRIKVLLEQRNLVALQHLLQDESGEVQDIIIRIMNLPDALELLKPSNTKLEHVNKLAQIKEWEKDGYDIDTALSLR